MKELIPFLRGLFERFNKGNTLSLSAPYQLIERNRNPQGVVFQRQIGIGGTAKVYEATQTFDKNAPETIAFKTPIKRLEKALQAVFEKEFLLLTKLNHPYIIKAFYFINQNGINGMAMELFRGKDLDSFIRDGTISNSHIVQIISQIAEVIDYLANPRNFDDGEPVFHRDLTLGNIFIREGSGDIVVIDFAFANKVHPKSWGTLEYMPTETIYGTKPSSLATELYHLGVILYECLVGSYYKPDKNPSLKTAYLTKKNSFDDFDNNRLHTCLNYRGLSINNVQVIHNFLAKNLGKDSYEERSNYSSAKEFVEEFLSAFNPSSK